MAPTGIGRPFKMGWGMVADAWSGRRSNNKLGCLSELRVLFRRRGRRMRGCGRDICLSTEPFGIPPGLRQNAGADPSRSRDLLRRAVSWNGWYRHFRSSSISTGVSQGTQEEARGGVPGEGDVLLSGAKGDGAGGANGCPTRKSRKIIIFLDLTPNLSPRRTFPVSSGWRDRAKQIVVEIRFDLY